MDVTNHHSNNAVTTVPRSPDEDHPSFAVVVLHHPGPLFSGIVDNVGVRAPQSQLVQHVVDELLSLLPVMQRAVLDSVKSEEGLSSGTVRQDLGGG